MQESTPEKTPLPPKFLTATYILLIHQTSRYINDLQNHLEAIPELRHLIPISLNDTATYNHLNLNQPGCGRYWSQAIEQGKVAAVIAHPPADTWNILRTTRSTTEHWGQINHSALKLAKTASFNRQLQNTIMLTYIAYFTKTPSLILHDAPSPDRERPSIWQLPQIQTLSQQPNTSTTDIDLCQFGHNAKHSTRILASHMPEAQRSFQSRPNASRCTCNCAYYAPDHYTKHYNTFALPDDLNDHIAQLITQAVTINNADVQPINAQTSYEGYLPLDPYITYTY